MTNQPKAVTVARVGEPTRTYEDVLDIDMVCGRWQLGCQYARILLGADAEITEIRDEEPPCETT